MTRSNRLFPLMATLLLGISLFSAGCGGETGVSPSESESSVTAPGQTLQTTSVSTAKPSPTRNQASLSAQEIAMGSLKASQELKSIGFDLDFSMSLGLPNMGTMNMQQTGSAVIDLGGKQMDMAMNMTMDIPNQGKQSGTGEIIAANGWLYMRTTVTGAADQWTKMKLTDDLWAAQNRFAGTTAFLTSPTGIVVTGSETIRGVDCYVLSIDPDMALLSNWVAGQTQPGQTSPSTSGADLSKTLESFTVKEWIAKSTLLPAKSQVSVKLNTGSGSSGAATEMQMNVVVTFTDYGKTVDIKVPEAALNAKEILTTK